MIHMNFKFNTIPVKIPSQSSVETDRLILKFTWKHKVVRLVKTILKKENTLETVLLDFRIYYKATVSKTVCY